MNLRRPNWRLLGLLFVIITVVTTVVISNNKHKKPTFTTRQACSILTATIVHELAGNTVVPQAERDALTNNTRTTYCVYRGSQSSVALVVRSARNAQGVALNKSAFTSPVGTTVAVRGYGDAAYWAPAFAQLNILEHNNWYILSNGSNVPAQRTLPDAKKLADLVLPDL